MPAGPSHSNATIPLFATLIALAGLGEQMTADHAGGILLIFAVLSYVYLRHIEHVSWRLVTPSLVIVLGPFTVKVFG